MAPSSSRVTAAMRLTAFDEGAHDYPVKPFDSERLARLA